MGCSEFFSLFERFGVLRVVELDPLVSWAAPSFCSLTSIGSLGGGYRLFFLYKVIQIQNSLESNFIGNWLIVSLTCKVGLAISEDAK